MKNQQHKSHIPIHIRPHHSKPYRAHHLGLAGVSIFIILVSTVFIGIFYFNKPVPPPDTTYEAGTASTVSRSLRVQSTYGYQVTANLDSFEVRIVRDDQDEATPQIITNPTELNSPEAISSVRLLPKSGSTTSSARATTLTVSQLSKSKKTPSEIARAQLGEPEEATIKEVEATTEEIANQQFDKYTYRYDSTLLDSEPIFSIIWIHAAEERTYILALQGLVGTADIPAIYGKPLASFQLGHTLAAQFFQQLSGPWSDRSISSGQYLSDLVSPAVTKIYHLACGSIKLQNQSLAEDQCRAVTGSGFLVSNDGYIATNGHVVVYEPEDALVDILLSDPSQLSSFLIDVIGMSSQQIPSLNARPEELAAVVAKIYELPDGTIKFQEKHEALLVSLGSEPILPETEEDIAALFNFRSTRSIKKAKLVGFNYTGKDQLNILSGSNEGFTQSDVALLKIPLKNAPLINLAQPADIYPGQDIAIIGFPSDAENQLVDTSELVVSITNGTISSVRTAAGGEGRLLQTDTDASQGNSGGPAVTTSGDAVGLLTYRFKDATTQNAAKSYIRDIADFRDLLREESVTLTLNSEVQQAWSNGLQLYSEGRFTAALEDFDRVKELYPPHRLADAYISAAQENVALGLNRQGSPYIFYLGLFIGGGMLILSVRLILHHRVHHKAYKEVSANQPAQPTPPPAVETD